MPSESMDLQSLSSPSFFSDDKRFHSERQVGFWKSDTWLDQREGNTANTKTSQYENSLFSSSFSELFTRKLRLSSNNAVYGHSIDTVASHYEEEEPLESLEELEAQTIGNLLPNDDDLFSGVTEGLDSIVLPNVAEAEELDVFSSVGGMDLGDDDSNVVRKASELPGLCTGLVAGEHPSRTLFVRNINSNVEDSELKALFEQYGEIRTLYTACKHRGFVMVSYYDIRAARDAMKALQNRPLRRRKLDIHYSIPKDDTSEKDENQSTLVVFNPDSSVSNNELSQIFGAYGEIKEIHETPQRSQYKFIEFYDVRSAEAALHTLNRSDISEKQIKVEPSHPGCSRRCLVQQLPSEGRDECYPYEHPHSPPNKATVAVSVGPNLSINKDIGTSSGVNSTMQAPFLESTIHHGNSFNVSNSLTYMVRAGSIGNQSVMAESGHLKGQLRFDVQGASTFHPRSLPEYRNGLSRGFSYAGNGSHPPGHNYSWSNCYYPQHPNMMWPNSPSSVNGICSVHPTAGFHGLPRAPSHMLNTGVPIYNHRVGSAPTVNSSLWDRRHAYVRESPEASTFHPGSLGSMRGLQLLHPRSSVYNGREQIIPIMNSAESPHERARTRRNEGSINQADKKQYELDIDRIIRGEDKRTTLMLKNIPNKYTSKMLLAAIDEHHRGNYDFIYLPIDFKNKCNVGYAFINMVDPSQIVTFYQTFNGKKWEKFNSEKVASLSYARIQGKAALVAHFQNSSLMNEDKRCRPILFNTEGPNAGDQMPFPMGANVRIRPGKARSTSHEENNQESPSNMENEENSSNGETCSSKESG